MKKISILTLLLNLTFFSAKAGDVVDLRFGWQDGLTLNVTRQFNRLTTFQGKEEKVASECTFTWITSKKGENYFISFDNFKETVLESAPSSNDAVVLLEYLSRKIEPILPTIIVDSNAQPVNLEGIDDVKVKIRREIDAIDSQNDPQFDMFKKMLLNDQALQVRALEDWNRMVQVWSGNEGAELGGSFQATGTTGDAAGKPVENLWIYTVDKGRSPNTVALRIVQRPVKRDLKRMLDSMLGGNAFKTLGIPIDSELIFENIFITHSDPKTLIPDSYKKEKVWGAVNIQ